MDPIKILQRAWHILWNYRTLWIFGLVLAVAAGSSYNGGGNNGVQFNDHGNNYQTPPPESMQELFRDLSRGMQKFFQEGIPQMDISGRVLISFLWIVGAFIVLMLIFGIFLAVARYVSETAVIRMVDEYENTGTKMSVRQGIRIGWSRTAWRLFLINLIVNLPGILLFLFLLVAGVVILLGVINGNVVFTTVNIVSTIGLVFLSIFVVVILSILLGLLRHFFWRVCVLEDADVGESLRRGLDLVREHWKDVVIMWLVMVGLGIAWIIVSIIAAIVTLPVVLVTIFLAMLVVAVPTLVLVGLFSLFLTGFLPWVAAVIFVMPLFAILAFSPWLLLGSWQRVFTSTVWTLTYRELKALPVLSPQPSTQPATDGGSVLA